MVTASPHNYHSGHHKTTEEEGDSRIPGLEAVKVNGRLQVELEEDGDGSSRQNK